MSRSRYVIGSFKHRVAVCSMKDVVDEAGQMRLSREDVYHCWAVVKPMAPSMFGKSGYAIKQGENARTHRIIIRFRRDIDFTSSAWIFEERLQSGNRWFKILAIVDSGEDGEYIEFDARLVERGAETSPPVTENSCEPMAAEPLPAGVTL